MQDALTGREWEIRAFELRASSIRPGEPFPLRVSFDFESAQSAISVATEMRFVSDATHLELDNVDFLAHGLDPGDLVLLLEFLQLTLDPEVLERASLSTSIQVTGAGTVDHTARTVDFSGALHLRGGSVAGQSPPQDPPAVVILPLTVGGTVDRPIFEIDRGGSVL